MEQTKKYKSITKDEVDNLIKICRTFSANVERDTCLLWLTYRHGLRVSECINLKWKDIYFEDNRIYINRAKGSISGYHPLSAEDRRYLLALKRKVKYNSTHDYVFQKSDGNKLNRNSVYYLIKRLCERMGLVSIHPHTLRHSCGNHMALAGVPTINIKEWLGHKKIDNTVIYTEEAGKQFDNLQKWW